MNILSFTTATAIDDIAENHGLNPGGHFWSDIARLINHYEGIELPPESDFDPSGDLFTLFGPANDQFAVWQKRLTELMNSPQQIDQLIRQANNDNHDWDDQTPATTSGPKTLG